MIARWIALAVLQVGLAVAANAAELAPELRALIEGFQAHRRTADAYLRTQNIELAAIEIERLRERWAADRARLPALPADAALAEALAETETAVARSLAAADAGDVARARDLLERAAVPLDAWRRSNGVRLFSDCIGEVSQAHAALDRFRENPPDLSDPGTAAPIAAATAAVLSALSRCDREAAPALRQEGEFRRLIDGMSESVRQIPQAIAARDHARLHRLLIEQRSFERLLVFRYG
jgi:hypothetical protein